MKNLVHKIAILSFLCILLPSVLPAQEQLIFIAEQDTVAYHFMSGDELIIRAGERIVLNRNDVRYGNVHRHGGFHLVMSFSDEQGISRSVFAKHFRPLNTGGVFCEDIFIDYPIEHSDGVAIRQMSDSPIVIGDVDAMWVPYYYREVLMGQDRDRLLEIRPGLIQLQGHISGEFFPWHGTSQADIQNGRAMFYNSVVKLGLGTHIILRNILRMDFGYRVDGVISDGDQRERWPWVFLRGSEFWDRYRPGQAVTLLLYLDGEYLDIYTSSGIQVATYIRVGREFIAQYQSLIRTNTADLTNVRWPSRADGSTGVRPRGSR